MKKIVSMLLAVAMSLSIMSTSTVFAQSTNNQNESQGLYVVSSETPDTVIAYAVEIFPDMMRSFLINNEYYELNSYYLGSPIRIPGYDNAQHSFYHFAIISEGTVFATLSVYDNGTEYLGQLEKGIMTEKLNAMMDESSVNSPILFFSNDDGLYAVVNNRVESMTPGTTNEATIPNVEKRISTTNNIVDMQESINASYDFNEIVPFATSNPLPVKSVAQTEDGKFTSPQMNWCGAAVTAALINYAKSKSLTAKSVTIEALGSAKNEGMTNAQLIKVAKNYSLTIKEVNPLSYTNAKTEIDNGKPIFMQMQRSNGTEKFYHALGLIGYSSTKYTCINPWYENSIEITKNDTGTSVQYISGDRTYKWYKALTGWK